MYCEGGQRQEKKAVSVTSMSCCWTMVRIAKISDHKSIFSFILLPHSIAHRNDLSPPPLRPLWAGLQLRADWFVLLAPLLILSIALRVLAYLGPGKGRAPKECFAMLLLHGILLGCILVPDVLAALWDFATQGPLAFVTALAVHAVARTWKRCGGGDDGFSGGREGERKKSDEGRRSLSELKERESRRSATERRCDPEASPV